MTNEFKVRSVSFDEEKSVQEIEAQLLKEHEEKQGISSEEKPVETTVVGSDGTIEKESVEETPGETPRELEDTDVLTYLKNRYNKEINSVDELFSARKEAEELPEDVSAFLKFKRDTGRGFEDFVQINKDYDKIPANDLLVEYLKQTNPDLDDEDIKFEVESRYAYNEDYDDAKEVKSKQIAMKKDLAKAKEYFNKQKEQYKIPLESREGFVPENEKGNYEAFKKYSKETEEMQKQQMERSEFFAKKTEEVFNDKFKGFEFNVGEGDVSFKPSNSEQMKKAQSDVSQFIGSFLDENGFIKNAEAYHKAIAVAMNPDSFAKFFYEQGQADATDDVTRKIKNINMSERKMSEASTKVDGMQVKSLSPESGNGLKIRSMKRI